MPKTPLTDKALGRVRWDEKNRWWHFKAKTAAGLPIHCIIHTLEERPGVECLQHVRQTIRWLRANEPKLHRRVAVGMFDYLEREDIREPGKDQVNSAEVIEANIRIAEASFFETHPARVGYETRGLLQRCHWVGLSITIDAKGRTVDGPEFS